MEGIGNDFLDVKIRRRTERDFGQPAGMGGSPPQRSAHRLIGDAPCQRMGRKICAMTSRSAQRLFRN